VALVDAIPHRAHRPFNLRPFSLSRLHENCEQDDSAIRRDVVRDPRLLPAESEAQFTQLAVQLECERLTEVSERATRG
jgi:hypothetical protein